MAGLIPIEKVVYGICDEAGDTAHKNFMKYLRFANLIYKDLCLYVIPDSQELKIYSSVTKINDNYYAELPEDYVYYTKIGLCVNGRTVVLGLNEDLCAGSDPYSSPIFCP